LVRRPPTRTPDTALVSPTPTESSPRGANGLLAGINTRSCGDCVLEVKVRRLSRNGNTWVIPVASLIRSARESLHALTPAIYRNRISFGLFGDPRVDRRRRRSAREIGSGRERLLLGDEEALQVLKIRDRGYHAQAGDDGLATTPLPAVGIDLASLGPLTSDPELAGWAGLINYFGGIC